MKNIKVKSISKYLIDEYGNVFKPSGEKRKPKINVHGYSEYSFFKAPNRKTYRTHRLVALTFIPNPDNKPQVNHKDGNKLNNHVSNLEWCTASENNFHSVKKLGNRNFSKTMFSSENNPSIKRKRKVLITKGLKVGVFDSLKQAGIANGVNGSYLSRIARGSINSSRFVAKFV